MKSWRNWVQNLSLIPITLIVSLSAFAGPQDFEEEGAYLDPPYSKTEKPTWVDKGIIPYANRTRLLNRSDTETLIERQTSVKAQGSRGTCSIFSATAYLESLIVIRDREDARQYDLSEEWLEYLVMRNAFDDGSTSSKNLSTFAQQGSVEEPFMPYIGETWKTVNDSPLAKLRCGKVPSAVLKQCLLGHRDPRLLMTKDQDLLREGGEFYDPEFQKARTRAREMLAEKGLNQLTRKWLNSARDAKTLLAAGVPVLLDLDFFYGAWNHSQASNKGITRNLDHWSKGIVGYPEPGSLDQKVSLADPAGHSIVLVGYDDTVQVTIKSQMQDGSVKTFTYTGVYYFKNSWGSSSFGASFTLNGKNYPGYGMVTQKYADEFGQFMVGSLARLP